MENPDNTNSIQNRNTAFINEEPILKYWEMVIRNKNLKKNTNPNVKIEAVDNSKNMQVKIIK